MHRSSSAGFDFKEAFRRRFLLATLVDRNAEYITQHRLYELARFWMALHGDCQGTIDTSQKDRPLSSVRNAKSSQFL
jgi:hypothetical protein